MTGSQSAAHKLTAFGVIAAVAILLRPPPAAAQTWTGATSGNWATVSNWSTPPLIGADTQLAFGATTHADMTNNVFIQFLLNRMTFNAGDPAYTLTGSPLFFRTSSGNVSPSIVMNSDSALTIGTGIDILNGLTINGTGAGTVTLNGAISNSGGLTYAGAGTLALGGSSNTYSGGTFVNSGSLLLANGSALPSGRAVTVAAGATLNTGGLSNTPATAIGTLALNGGTFKVPSGSGNYYLNQLQMTDGTVDLTGTSNFGLRFTGAGAGITINSGTVFGTVTWTGDATARVQNDTLNPLPIYLNSANLNVGVILAGGANNQTFVISGSGGVRLQNTGNTASMTASGIVLYSSDLSTDLGAGAFGTLGAGAITLADGGSVEYDGATATTAKPLSLTGFGGHVRIGGGGTNLKMTGVISGPGAALTVDEGYYNFTGPGPKTLTLTAANSYSGATYVGINVTLAIPTIANAGGGGVNSPIGASSNAASNLVLGDTLTRGTLLLTGTDAAYGTDRGLTVLGVYTTPLYPGAGGAIGVANQDTTLTWSGPIVGSGSFIKTGPGTLVLANAANTFTGGAYVEAGRLALGSGTAIPTGGNVTVFAGAEFSTAGLSNGTVSSSSNAIGTLTLNGGTFSIPSGNGDYYLNKLATGPTGGAVDYTGSGNSYLHLTGAGAGIAVAGNSTWTGAPQSRIQNDTAAPIDINISNYATLTNGIILANGTNGQGFRLIGPDHVNNVATLVLTNPDNSADLIADSTGYIQVADMAHLGSGSLTLQDTAHDFRPGTLWYTGPAASSSKPITLGVGGGHVYVFTPGTNLTLSGTISEPLGSPGQPLQVSGAYFGPSTLTLTGSNTFTGPVFVQYEGVLSVGTIANGGMDSPLGKSSSAPGNLILGGGPIGGTGTLKYTGSTATTDRGLTLGDYSGTVEVTDSAANLKFTGQFTGTGSLFKTGSGTLTLANATNNYSGYTFVNAGRLALGSATAIRAGGNVVVDPGATFDTAGLVNSAATAIGTVSINGTLRTAPTAGSAYYYLNQLATGGTVDATGAADFSGLAFVNARAAINVYGNSTWTGPNTFFIVNATAGVEMPITIAPNVTLATSLSLATLGQTFPFTQFLITGGGTYYATAPGAYTPYASVRVSGARLRADDIWYLFTVLVDLDGGTFAYGGPNGTTGTPFFVGPGGGTVEVINPTTTLGINGYVGGTDQYPLTKTGPGTLALFDTSSTHFGGITVSGGRLDVSDDAQLGVANPTVNPAGTLRYTANATTTRTFNLAGGKLEAAAGVTLTLDGAAVNGGFLRGAGTFAVTGGSTLTAATTLAGTTLNQTGPAAYVDFGNGGRLTVAGGLAAPATAFDGFTNQGSGSITVGAASKISAADFQTYGVLTLAPGPSAAQATRLTNVGFAPLFFNGGSRTFIGTPQTAGQNLALVDLHGQNAIVAGGLFVNNGFVGDSTASGATIIADFGSLVKGAGIYANPVITQNGGKFQAGNSPGAASFGRFVFGPAGVDNYVFAIDDAAGTAGPRPDALGQVSGWGLVKAVVGVGMPGDLTWTATPASKLTVALDTLINPTTVGVDVPGPMDHFDPTRSYIWPAVEWAGTYSGPADAAALVAATSFDSGGFLNPIAGTFGWQLDSAGQSLSLTYTPTAVPEPGTLALVGLAAAGLAWRRRKRCMVLTAALALLITGPAPAQYVWTGAFTTEWNYGLNWSPSGNNYPNSATATATFGDGVGTHSVNISPSVSAQSLSFTNSTGNYTLTSSPGQVLSEVSSITVDAAVTGVQTINLANIPSTGSLTYARGTGYTPLTITNNGTAAGASLVIGPNTVIGPPSGGSAVGVVVGGTGTTLINGSFASAPNVFMPALTVNGPGTVILSRATPFALFYPTINGGTLQLDTGHEMPAGTNIGVNGGQFNIGTGSNTAATAIDNLSLNNSGTFRVPGGIGNYYLLILQMYGGTVDFSVSSNFWLRFVGSTINSTNTPPTIHTYGGSTTSTWIGGGLSRIQNDSTAPMTITVDAGSTANGIDLEAGIALSQNGGHGFVKAGEGVMRLTNLGSNADITHNQGILRVDDISTGGVGALGTGAITMGNATLQYGGPTASTSKTLTITGNAAIQVLTDGANLTYAGTITESGSSHPFRAYGPFVGGTSSTLTFPGAKSYSGSTTIDGNGVLAIPNIFNGGTISPIGNSSAAPSNLVLGSDGYRGTLLLTGTNTNYFTDRGATVNGLYPVGGGAVGVDNAGTSLTWSGQITGAGSFIKTGPGTLILTNKTNNFAGGTFVEGGTLTVGVGDPPIPAGSNVSVSAGAAFTVGFTSGDNAAAPIGTLTLNGGTFKIPAGSPAYYLNQLVIGPAGGVVDFTGSTNALIVYAGAGAGATIGTNTTWGDGSFGAGYGVSPVFSIAPAVTLTSSAQLYNGPYRITGGGTYYPTAAPYGIGIQATSYVVSQARVRVDDLSVTGGSATVLGPTGPGSFTLDGGTLQYTGPTQSTPFPITLGPGGGVIEVANATTTLTLTGPIAGAANSTTGRLTKTGPGNLILDNPANAYLGGIAVSGGRLDVGDDAQLGLANPTVNPFGTLRYTATTTTARTFTLNAGTLEAPAGVTLTLSGAAVGGGFLRGAGTFAATGGTVMSGTTTFASTPVSVTGPAAFVNFVNGGPLTVADGLVGAVTADGLTNKVGGRIVVGAGSTVGLADFESYGTLTLVPASGSPATRLTNTGSSPLNFGGGSRTFIGTPQTAGQNLALVDLHGQNAIVAGGLFVNNGFVGDSTQSGATIIADFGSLVKGAGTFANSVITQNGGKFQAGNSPGAASFGRFVFGPGGVDNYVFAIDDAVGNAGPSPDALGHVSGWGLVKAVVGPAMPGDFVWTATPAAKLTVALDTLLNPTTVGVDVPGPMDHFDPSASYIWPAAEWAGLYSGPGDAVALAAATSFDTGGFLNPIAGTFGWQLDSAGHSLSLTYTPSAVPEPGTLALVGLAAAGLAWRRRGLVLTLPVALVMAIAPPASAQYTWIGGSGPAWNNAANWTPTGFPNSATATATFSGPTSATVIIGTSMVTQSVTFNNATGNYTVNALGGQTLSGVTAITVASGVTGLETIDLPNISSGSLLFPTGSNLTITNDSTAAGTTLVFGPNTVIGTPGFGGVVVAGAGNTQISGSFAASPFAVDGGLTKNGTGTLVMSNAANSYAGGTFVNAGTLAIGANGAAIPASTGVTVQAGATLDFRTFTNGSANFLNVTLNGGTLKATGATNSDIYIQQLTMTGGKVDFTNLPFTWLHVINTLGIVTNASVTTATLIGSGNCELLNDAGNVSMPITVAAGALGGIDLDVGLKLVCQSSTASFNKLGPGTMRLTNPGNTANITVSAGNLLVDDMAALGSGIVNLGNGGLVYGGPTATSAKPLTLGDSTSNIVVATVAVTTPAASLTLTGLINETISSRGTLKVLGSGTQPSTLTLTNANSSYSYQTIITGQAVVAIPTIANVGSPGPIGNSVSVLPGMPHLILGGDGRGTLLYTGTDTAPSTNRAVLVQGIYGDADGGTIGVQNLGTSLTVSGKITGSGSFIKTGLGTLTLTNQTNDYTGGTYVEAGTLNVGASGAVIPANTDVTVSSGATLKIGFTAGDNFAAPLGRVTLNGGTLSIPAGNPLNPLYYNLNRLVTGPAGGTVDFFNSTGSVFFTGPGAGATINGNTTWTGSNLSGVASPSGTASDLTIAPNVSLTCGVLELAGAYRIVGGGTLYMPAPIGNGGVRGSSDAFYTVTQGRLRADDLSVSAAGYSVLGVVLPGFLTLDGGALQYTGLTASTTMPITLGPTGGAVEVSNAATTLTLTGDIGPAFGSSAGLLTKSGPGALVLNNLANTYFGGITVSGGRLDVSDDAQLGLASPTVNPAGTLRYTASANTSRTFNLAGGTLEAPAGVTLILDGAAVNGGFLRGSGTFAVTGGTVLSGATTASSTAVTVTGPASFVNFTNGGRLTVAAGPAAPTDFSLLTNQGSGAITVGATSKLNVVDFQTYGLLTLTPGPSAGSATRLTNTGSSPLYFNGGSRTFIGTPQTAGQNLALLDLHGQNAVVAGGLFVNNGFVGDSTGNGATIVADFGSLVKGAGTFANAVVTQNGGKFQAGNSPGAASFGKFVFGPGGVDNYVFAIDDATGTAGPSPDALGHVSGWGLVKAVVGPAMPGDFVWTATPAAKLTVALDTLLNPTMVGVDVPGPMDHFDPTRAYSWPAVEWAGLYSGPADAAALAAATSLDTGGFLNPVAGSFGWQFDAARHSLSLTYTPSAVPEPGTLALVAAASGGAGLARRRFSRLSV